MNIFRPHSVAVSESTRWKLSRIAQARNSSDEEGGKESADSVAEEVLDNWLKTTYPGLTALWLAREAMEKRAVELVQGEVHRPVPAR